MMTVAFNERLRSLLDSDACYAPLPLGTWMEGGCVLLASALQRVIPDGTIRMVGRPAEGRPHYTRDHAVLEASLDGQTVWIDYDGIQSPERLMAKVQQEWSMPETLTGPFDAADLADHEMLPCESRIDRLASYLSELMATMPQWNSSAFQVMPDTPSDDVPQIVTCGDSAVPG